MKNGSPVGTSLPNQGHDSSRLLPEWPHVGGLLEDAQGDGTPPSGPGREFLASTLPYVHDHMTGSHASSMEKLDNPPLFGSEFPTWAHVMDTVVVCYLEWDPPLPPVPGYPFQHLILLPSCSRTTQGPLVLGQLQATSEDTEGQNQGQT